MGLKITNIIPKREKNLEGRFIVALPFVDIGVDEYSRIEHRGGTLDTTPEGAVGNYLFRVVPHKARIILANLRDRYGGAGNYAMRVPENYTDDDENELIGEDRRVAEEIEISTYFAKKYGKTDARFFLKDVRRILREFEGLRTRH